ncbi:small ribosomal subunit protein bS18m-like isoform X2 [Argopecten irradians]|uniref:small ribosomal subunit protein bS18m-like isoform X2 n=1 Tax=Argopecten irradians TaxID=31199 RepID=UPI003711F545
MKIWAIGYQPIILRNYSQSADGTKAESEETEMTLKDRFDRRNGPILPYNLSNRRHYRRRKVFSAKHVENLLAEMEEKKSFEADHPTEMKFDPYEPEQRKCILCKTNVPVDYKNVRLLSQFVSPYTGRIFGRHQTGLCDHMQKKVANSINRAQNAGFMPKMYKDRAFVHDPKLYDIFARQRKSNFKK